MGDSNSKYKGVKSKTKGKKKGKIPVYKQTSTNKGDRFKLSDEDMNIISSEGKKFNEDYLASPKYKERLTKEYKRQSSYDGELNKIGINSEGSDYLLEKKYEEEGKNPPSYLDKLQFNLANRYDNIKKVSASWFDNQSDYHSRADKMIEKRKGNLKKLPNPTYKYSKDSLGSYNQWDKTINFNPYSATPETADHEYSHASTRANRDILNNTYKEIRDMANQNPKKKERNFGYMGQDYIDKDGDDKKILDLKKEIRNSENERLDDYFTDPTEVKARLDVSRKLLKWGSDNEKGTNNPFTKDATDEDLEYLKNSGEQNVQDLFNHYTPKQIKWMLNNIAKAEKSKTKSKYKKVNAKKLVT